MKTIEIDGLGERLKKYEQVSESYLVPGLPFMIRLDGRAFSAYSKRFKKPFDEVLSGAMIETTKALMQEFQASVGYTQSDEITLLFNGKDQLPFGGRVQKLVSLTAAFASVVFNQYIRDNSDIRKVAVMDSRVFTLPSIAEGLTCLAWREMDATRNSISMAAQSVFSHKQLNKRGTKAKLTMLKDYGIDWEDYPHHFKYGTYVVKKRVCRPLDVETLAKIPEKYREQHAVVTRTEYETCTLSFARFPAITVEHLTRAAENQL